jgi:uncharacterized protein with HEPN domain
VTIVITITPFATEQIQQQGIHEAIQRIHEAIQKIHEAIQGTHEAIQGIGGLSIKVVILQYVLIEALSPLILLISLK